MARPRGPDLRSGAALLLCLAGCAPGLPGPGGGAPAASPAPHVPWTPPSPSAAPTAPQPGLEQIPPDLAQRLRQLTAADVVDLALRNNPTTLQAWANARAAAAAYGASRGAYFPEVDASGSITHVKTAATGGRVAVTQTTYGPSATLTWLLLKLVVPPSVKPFLAEAFLASVVTSVEFWTARSLTAAIAAASAAVCISRRVFQSPPTSIARPASAKKKTIDRPVSTAICPD